MSERYTGLPPKLKEAVFARDNYRCRWCGTTNSRFGYDVHHIHYRRGYSYDVIDNLVTLDRICHGYVHDSYTIPKNQAQEILTYLISPAGHGRTGAAELRARTTETDKHQTGNSGPVGRLLHLD